MTKLEDQLASWTGPSSSSEKDKQERAERMVRQAVRAHDGFADGGIQVFAKGSYANETNVRSDSDVDIAVKCTKVMYWEDHKTNAHTPGPGYDGIWTPSYLRSELVTALEAKFPGEVDTSGSTAIHIAATSSRVDIDVVPCFDFRHYFSDTSWRDGSKVFKKTGGSLVNYSDQQLTNGRAKNVATNYNYKKSVRIIKRLENAMVSAGESDELASYFIECLVYNVPNTILTRSTWTGTVRGILSHMWTELDGAEPTDGSERWLEVNECKYLFNNKQSWSRADARAFAKAAWNYLELGE